MLLARQVAVRGEEREGEGGGGEGRGRTSRVLSATYRARVVKDHKTDYVGCRYMCVCTYTLCIHVSST